jgi:hypothetical protein
MRTEIRQARRIVKMSKIVKGTIAVLGMVLVGYLLVRGCLDVGTEIGIKVGELLYSGQ